jgi:hypothetical protein
MYKVGVLGGKVNRKIAKLVSKRLQRKRRACLRLPIDAVHAQMRGFLAFSLAWPQRQG